MIEKKVSFKSGGLNLSGILHLPPKPTKSAVIFANGYPDSYLEHHAPIVAARAFCQNGFAALRFNPRGRDPSKGSFVAHNGMLGQALDIENAVKFARKKGFRNIGVVGHSLGASAAILARKKHVKALVLWEPSSVKVLKKFFLTKKIRQDIKRDGYSANRKYGLVTTRDFIGDIVRFKGDIVYRLSESDMRPTLFISGSDTLLAPGTKAYFEAAKGPKSLKTIKGATHTFDAYDHERLLLKYTVGWLKEYLI